MKIIPSLVFLLSLTLSYLAKAQDNKQDASATKAALLAQQQLDAYNNGDIDAFLVPYAETVEVYTFPNELSYKGKEKMRPRYAKFFEQYPDLHCELVNRIVQGNTVIDHERIQGIPGRSPFEAIAIYKIEDNKIAKVYFVR
ncbi:MAG: nuclear transport factor 2 family protein [Thermonemataceae bacterium]